MAEPIILYLDQGMTRPYIIDVSDFSAFRTGSSLNPGHTATITIGEDEEVVSYYSSNPNNVNFQQVADGTRLASTVPGNEHLIDTTYYIAPNMSADVKLDYEDPDDPTHPNYNFSVKYYFNGQLLSGFTTSYTFPNTPSYQFTLHVGKFKIGRTEEICTGFYLRINDRTVRLSVVSDNYWDGSLEVPKYQNSTPAATSGGGHQPTGNITKPNMEIIHYADDLKRRITNHGPRIYNVTDPLNATAFAMDKVYEMLWSDSIWDNWKNKKYGVFGGIISWHKLPILINGGTTVHTITINGQQYPLGSASATLLSDDKYWKIFESKYIPEIFGGFLDYGEYTTATLYLPFCGIVNLDVDKIMGGYVNVHYCIDVYTGNCIAIVQTISKEGEKQIYGQYPGNCAYKYPVTGHDNGGFEAIGSFIGNATSAIGSAASGNVASVVSSIGNMATTEIMRSSHTQMNGTFCGNVSCLGDLRVFIIVTRPKPITVEQFTTINGFPAASGGVVENYKLNDSSTNIYVQGRIDVSQIDVATDAEREAIVAAFREGVYV